MQSLYNTPHYNMNLDTTLVMLWLPNFLPWNFTMELLENDNFMVIFLEFLCKIAPQFIYNMGHSFPPLTSSFRVINTACYRYIFHSSSKIKATSVFIVVSVFFLVHSSISANRKYNMSKIQGLFKDFSRLSYSFKGLKVYGKS